MGCDYNVGINGQASLQGPIEEIAKIEAGEAEGLLRNLGIPVHPCLLPAFHNCYSLYIQKNIFNNTLKD